jgi:hypothetical protein
MILKEFPGEFDLFIDRGKRFRYFSKQSKEGIMNMISRKNSMMCNVYFPFYERAKIKFLKGPAVKHLKYRLNDDPNHYSFSEMRDRVFELTIIKGYVLRFFLVNEKTGKKSSFINLDIFRIWEPEKKSYEVMNYAIDISEYLKEIGLYSGKVLK